MSSNCLSKNLNILTFRIDSTFKFLACFLLSKSQNGHTVFQLVLILKHIRLDIKKCGILTDSKVMLVLLCLTV